MEGYIYNLFSFNDKKLFYFLKVKQNISGINCWALGQKDFKTTIDFVLETTLGIHILERLSF